MNFSNKLVYKINCKHYQLKLQTLPTQNCTHKIRFNKMLNFCWTCFLSLIIIQNTFLNPFNNGDLKEFSWNHTMKRFNCFPRRHSNCSCNVFTTQHWSQAELSHGCLYVFTHHKNEEQVLFICWLWIRKEGVWNSRATLWTTLYLKGIPMDSS